MPWRNMFLSSMIYGYSPHTPTVKDCLGVQKRVSTAVLRARYYPCHRSIHLRSQKHMHPWQARARRPLSVEGRPHGTQTHNKLCIMLALSCSTPPLS